MTINRLFQTGILVAILDSKESPGKVARIYAAPESRGYQTKYQPKMFYWFVPYSSNGLPSGIMGITRDARRKNIVKFSNVTILDAKLWDKFVA